MNVVVCFKSVYDDVAIRTNSDKTLDYQAVPHIVSLYDLNAIEWRAFAYCAYGRRYEDPRHDHA